MKKIQNFILPEHTNTLYEKEAISSISLTKEVAAKINELVDGINALSTTDLAWKQEQEGIIRKGVIFMKDNLLNSLNDLMVLLRDSGFIDDRIQYHCQNLKDRVENLLGNITEGTTTFDAEIIDARLDSDNAVWNNIGNLIRTINGLVNDLINASYFETEKVDTPIINGWLNRAGEYRANAATGEIHKCIKFEVMTGERYLIYSEYGWDMPDAVALDENNTMVKIYNTADNRRVNDGNLIITIPDKAKYLVVNSMYPAKKPVSARKIIKCDNRAIVDYVNNAVMSVKDEQTITSDNLITSVNTGMAIRAGETFTINNAGFVVGECAVTPGKIYIIKCGGSFECNPYVFYDKNGVPVDYAPTLPANSYESRNYEVIAPPQAATLKAAHYNGVTPVVFEVKGYTNGESWHHLKWCCLGDSLTEVNQRTNTRYYDYINEKTGINVVNMGVGGTGYKRGEDSGNAFYQRANDIPHDCDVVTIFGSGNDNAYFSSIGSATDTGTDTLCGCINRTIDNIYRVNPLVKIGVITPTPWINHQPNDNTKFKDYAAALKSVCELRGIPCLDLYHLSGFRPNEESYRNLVFSKDEGNGVHPNEEGHKIISSHIYNFLNSLISTY